MPRSIRNPKGLTLRRLLNNTVAYYRNRLTYMRRDVLRSVKIEQIHVYDGKQPGEARTTYRIRSFSYPQYWPYYTKKDSRGRTRSYQRTYRHEYEIILQMDELSLDSDRFKIRTGADRKWDFSPAGRAKKDSRGKIVEGNNVKRGINGDHFFRLSALRSRDQILYGRNYAEGLPVKTNPKMIHFLTKHELRVVEFLVSHGILQ